MGLKKENNYFEMIEGLVELSCEAAENLCDILKNFDLEKLQEKKDNLHNIEHNADIKKHDMIKKLSHEFIAPIEREDIMQLGEVIDNVTDLIEDVLVKIYMYNISKIKPEAVDLADVVKRCCYALRNTAKEFYNFQKSDTIHKYLIEINCLEEECDRIFTDSMRKLYRDTENALKIMIWKDMFESLENCCDACEHVSDLIELVIMKNT